MTSLTSQILPALESFGLWSYWLIGAAALLEGWWVTGLVAPGTLIVDAGGALVRLGYLDFIDLAWFVALGAILGGEASWFSGRWLGDRMPLPSGRAFQRAQDLVRRHGGPALVIGRFLGPVASLAALAAALSGMERRRFVLWNIISAACYALAHLALGYVAGDLLARVGPYLPRLVLPLVAIGVLCLFTWIVVRQARHAVPWLRALGAAARVRLAGWPLLQRAAARFPGTAAFLARRFDPGHGGGLLATAALALVIYLTGVFIDGALDLTLVPETQALDQRVANLAHAYWSPGGLALAGWFTQSGHVPVATLVALGAVLGLLSFGYRAEATGLAVAVIGDALTVTGLKLAFGRARPEISYFLETSNSFPSGHAAISVALYGTLALTLWRMRALGPVVAIPFGITMAFGLGLTRIYLVEHFLSDVLNGWVVGAIWMVIGLALAEQLRWRQRLSAAGAEAGPARRVSPLWRGVGVAAMLACFGSALWIGVAHRQTPIERGEIAPPMFEDLRSAIATQTLPLEVVALGGAPLPPVSVVVTGMGLEQVQAHLLAGGWTAVPEAGLWSIWAALRRDVTHRPQAGATEPLAFRDASPAALTLRSPDGDSALRIWKSGVTKAGQPVLALALAPEANSARWQPDAARAQLLKALGGQQEELPHQVVLVTAGG